MKHKFWGKQKHTELVLFISKMYNVVIFACIHILNNIEEVKAKLLKVGNVIPEDRKEAKKMRGWQKSRAEEEYAWRRRSNV